MPYMNLVSAIFLFVGVAVIGLAAKGLTQIRAMPQGKFIRTIHYVWTTVALLCGVWIALMGAVSISK